MPWGDRTGPFGMGSRTGRGLGYCSGYDAPGFAGFRPGMGRGFGFGRGPGRGPGRGFRAGFGPGFGRVGWGMGAGYDPYPPSPEQEKQFLVSEAQELKNALSNLEKRISEIEKQNQSE